MPTREYPFLFIHASGTRWNTKANRVTFLAEMRDSDGWIEDGRGAMKSYSSLILFFDDGWLAE